MTYAVVGGRYVIPMALCRPDTSSLAGINAMVTSPGRPPGVRGGMKNLTIDSGFRSEYGERAWICVGLKCFIPLIFLAAAGSARMVVSDDEGSNWRRVPSWQWSGLS